MAVIDRTAGIIVVRIAYDGEARAGKTTNLHALSRSLSRMVYTPPQPGERTLFFDWLEYTGGLFDGMQVRCEVVSVPGQEFLAARRELLVRSADVVVHVVDMSTASAERIDARLQELNGMCEPEEGPVPRGLLVQANKVDLAHALDLDALRDLCGRQPRAVGVREAVAKDGLGIRETFVFAVRLALDRVRELARLGEIPERAADAVGGEALLAWLRAREGTVPQSADMEHVVAPDVAGAEDDELRRDPIDDDHGDDASVPDVDARGAILQVLAENEVDEDERTTLVPDTTGDDDTLDTTWNAAQPALPDPSVPTGMIWPPLEGRVLLEEVTNCQLELNRTASGAWLATVGERWRLHSARDAEFPSLEAARRELLQSARAHTALGRLLSHPRAIVVAATGHGTWRLWQIVRIRPTLRDTLAMALGVDDAREVAARFAQVGTQLVELNSRREEFPQLPPCTLDSVGPGETHAEFVGLLSSLALVNEATLNLPLHAELLRREFTPVVRDWANDAGALRNSLADHGAASRNPLTRLVADTLQTMLSPP